MKSLLLSTMLFAFSCLIVLGGEETKCFNSLGSHCFTTLEEQDLIVKFDEPMDHFDYLSIQQEIESIGLILFAGYSTTGDVMVFRPIDLYSDAYMMESIHEIEHVDTIYFPLVDIDSSVVYYDIDRIQVGFGNELSEETILNIIDTAGCSVYEVYSNNSYVLNLGMGMEVFGTLELFSNSSQVSWVDLHRFGAWGSLTFNCDFFDTIDFSEKYRVDLEGEVPKLLIDYQHASSPCEKVRGYFIVSGTAIDYYGVYTSGMLASPCESTDTVLLPVEFDAENSVVTVHYYSQYDRCVIESMTYPLSPMYIEDGFENNGIHFTFQNHELRINTHSGTTRIEGINIYNLLGNKVLVNYPTNDSMEVSLNFTGVKQGIYIVQFIYGDSSSQSIKFFNY